MFVNLSNHPSDRWSEKQREAAACYGKIVDIAFPQIPPSVSYESIDELVRATSARIQTLLSSDNETEDAVMVEGEFVFTYRMVTVLKSMGIRAVAAVTVRVASEEKEKDGSIRRISRFMFEGFREY